MLVIKKFIILMHFGLAFGANRKYSFSVKNVCYQLYNDVIRDVYGIMSPTACSILCAEDNCCSVLFDEMTQRCITYSIFARSTMTGCGWKYAEIDLDMCRGPRPYTPPAPNQCDPGYSYGASDNKCRIDCESYGSSYGTFNGSSIAGYNNRMITGTSEQECKDACTAETTFECRTADMSYDGKCWLSTETALTKPGSYVQDSPYTHWQRNCASNGATVMHK